jgi:hypothetical protein
VSSRQMTVEEAIEQLLGCPMEADFGICAHDFPGMEDQYWKVSSLEPTEDGSLVLVEGASPPEPRDHTDNGSPPSQRGQQ